MAKDQPVVLTIADPILVKWLTSNPQHFNPNSNAIIMRCPAFGPVATPWPTVPDGVYDKADRLVRHNDPRLPPSPFAEIIKAIQRSSRKQLPKPKPQADA